LFHFTDIQNAVQIIEQGNLVCRSVLEKKGTMITDNASPDVITNTDPEWKDFVRLYFRPRTPTQYNNEGFRPPELRELGGAHCPVPIYFIFDAPRVLGKHDSMFSAGSLATDTKPFKTAAEFSQIPFQLIYHDKWFDQSEKSTIIFHRHAEVIVPIELDLKFLRYIWCRSQAEYQTLLHLLSPSARLRWDKRIGVGAKPNLFFRKWTFVEQADLSSTAVEFQFNRNTLTPGPFVAYVEILEEATGTIFKWRNDNYIANENLVLSTKNLIRPESYIVKLFLDGQLAFVDRYVEESAPF
jgi:hypothetical protein